MRLLKKDTNKSVTLPRIARMADHDLTAWANVVIMDLGRSFDNWNYKDGPTSEVSEHLNVLNQVWSELERRKP